MTSLIRSKLTTQDRLLRLNADLKISLWLRCGHLSATSAAAVNAPSARNHSRLPSRIHLGKSLTSQYLSRNLEAKRIHSSSLDMVWTVSSRSPCSWWYSWVVSCLRRHRLCSITQVLRISRIIRATISTGSRWEIWAGPMPCAKARLSVLLSPSPAPREWSQSTRSLLTQISHSMTLG